MVGHGQRSQLVLELRGKDSLVELALTEQTTRGQEVVAQAAQEQTPRQRLEATEATGCHIPFRELPRRILEVEAGRREVLEAARAARVVVVLVTEQAREETQRTTGVVEAEVETVQARELLVVTAIRE